MMRNLALVLFVTFTACSQAPQECGPATCGGCCNSVGVCGAGPADSTGACVTTPTTHDAGTVKPQDAGSTQAADDAGQGTSPFDAGQTVTPDAGGSTATEDAGAVVFDAGTIDSGTIVGGTVDSGTVDSGTVTAVDAGQPDCTSLRWSNVIVDQPVRLVNGPPSIGSNGTVVRIAIADDQSDRLRVASQTSAGWSISIVDAGILPEQVTQVVDSQGASHIALFDFSAGMLVVEGQPDAFTVKPMFSDGSTQGSSFYVGTRGQTMVQDSDGRLSVMVGDNTNHFGQWSREAGGTTWANTVLSTFSNQIYLDIAADGTDLHMVWLDTYRVTSALTITYSFRAGPTASWVSKPLASVSTQPTIAVDSNHVLHVAYYDATNFDLIYAHREPQGTWQFETVDSVGNVGYRARIAVDHTGGVHIVYEDELNGLKDAYRSAGAKTWAISVIDSVGTNADLLAGADGAAQVAYYDPGNHALRWATRAACH